MTKSTKPKLTDLRQELIDNDGVFDCDAVDLSHPGDVEHIISEMILVRSDSVEEVAERTATLVEMLRSQPKHHADEVFQRACSVAEARAYDIASDDYSCVPIFDAVLDGLRPWLREQGYPEPHAFPAMKS